MTDLGKNGFGWTGYTEPFIVPPTVTVAASQISVQNLGVVGVAGAVPIEYTTNRNSGLYVRAFDANGDALTFTSKDLNFDARMEFNKSRFLIEVGAVKAVVDTIVYNNVTELYTITCDASVDTVAGKAYRVIAKMVDVGTVSASKVYTEGKKVVEVYPFIA